MPDASNSDPEFLRAFAKAILDKNERENPRSFLSPGTVTGGNPGLGGAVPYLSVHVDGDPGDTVTSIPTLIGMRAAGTRVMILWDRPHGAYVIGATSPAIPCGRMANGCVDGESWPIFPNVKTALNFCCPEFSVAGVDVTNPLYIAIPGNGTYAASLDVRWSYTPNDPGATVRTISFTIEVEDEGGATIQVVAEGRSIDKSGQIVVSSCAFQTPPKARLVAYAMHNHVSNVSVIPASHFECVFVTDPVTPTFCIPDVVPPV